ncbi:MAG: hypothetical protein NC926_11055 [Candidatus Omnitrophica bacterium]|nr:hypothetical protein [Candidatus Omnitrophota bacterium]
MPNLEKHQKEIIKKYISKFKDFLNTETGKQWNEETYRRAKFIQKILSKEYLQKLNEDEFREMIKNLWASEIWGNKDYFVDKLIKDNGFNKIKIELMNLLYGNDTLDKRFDRFNKNIKGLGPSSITEILLLFSPDKYCSWNDKPKNTLPFLKIKLLPERFFKYKINGSDYLKCCEVLDLIKKELKDSGFKNANFIDVNFFLAFIYYEIIKKGEPEIDITEEKSVELTHTDIQGILLELGNLLGYETYVADPSKKYKDKKLGDIATLKQIPPFTYERIIENVRNIDVIWFEEEFPKFCFEVEHTTGVRDGLLRLYQVRKITDAKFFIIAPKEIIKKFETEIKKDPFIQIKDRYIFRSYEELIEIFEKTKEFNNIKERFFKNC